jgi:hypothetical protein
MNKRLRTPKIVLSAVVGFSIFAAAASAQPFGQKRTGPSFGFKFSGGLGYALDGGGDLENLRNGDLNYLADLGTETGMTVTTNWKKMSFLPNFDADLIFFITPNIGIGLGSGYISAQTKGELGWNYQYSGSEWWGTYMYDIADSWTREYKISAIPVRLSVYFSMLMNELNVYGYVGAGYYFGKLDHSRLEDGTLNYEDSSWYYWNEIWENTSQNTITETAKSNALGFHGGLGAEFMIGSNLALGVEVFGRFVNFNTWEGDYNYQETTHSKKWMESYGWYLDETDTFTWSESGKLWYYEIFDQDYNHQYGEMYIWQDQPDDPSYRNVRPAAINLNAVGIKLSLRIYFNLFK